MAYGWKEVACTTIGMMLRGITVSIIFICILLVWLFSLILDLRIYNFFGLVPACAMVGVFYLFDIIFVNEKFRICLDYKLGFIIKH